jgi:hypothetical protein
MAGWFAELLVGLGINLIAALIVILLFQDPVQKLIHRDAFRAVMGYMLPEQLRGELAWVYGFKTVCTETRCTVTLGQSGDPLLVKMRLRIDRTFENKSGAADKFNLSFDLEQWGHGASEITSFRYRTPGGDWIESSESRPTGTGGIEVVPVPMTLKPGEQARMIAEGFEIKQRNDEYTLVFLRPSDRPEIIALSEIDGMTIDVTFGSRHPKETADHGHFILPGTVLPYQGTRIRWWPTMHAELAP